MAVIVPEPDEQNGPELVLAVPPFAPVHGGGINSKAPGSGLALLGFPRMSSNTPTELVPITAPSAKYSVGVKLPVGGLANKGSI